MPEDLDDLLQRGYRYALSLAHEASAAEDVLQDAWVGLLRRGGPFHVGYLFSAIRNRWVDLQRRRKRLVFESIEGVAAGGEMHENLVTFPTAAALRRERGALAGALGKLRGEEREALFLAAVEGYTVSEISELLHRPLGSVSSLLRRGREKLRTALERSSKEVRP